METLISTDAFEAFLTDEGILIKEKPKAAKKVGMIVAVMGLVFLAISFVPMEGVSATWITTLFTAVFFYGGLILLPLGLALFIIKGVMGKEQTTEFNSDKNELVLRGKMIPFNEIEELSIQTADMMGRKMTTFLIKHKGRKKALINGTVIVQNINDVEKFLERLKKMIEI